MGKGKREKRNVGLGRGPLRVKSARRTFLFSFFPLLFFVSCRDAFTSRVDVVATAGDSQLLVDRLSDIFAQGKSLAVQRSVIERMAGLWVDYSLLAQRVVAGDSMLDSATVINTLWPEVQQRTADHFHDELQMKRSGYDSTKIDSIYDAGEYRLLQHVLFRLDGTQGAARDAKRKQAESVRARLAAGGTWADANRSNEDPRAKVAGGLIGVVVRGDMPGAFENAAFSLKPGEVSDVVESPLGYHIIRRPALREQRAAYATGLENRIVGRLDSIYFAGINSRRHARVTRDAPAVVRAALSDPQSNAHSTRVVGRFDGGRLTVSDMLRWIGAMPPQVQQQLAGASDSEIGVFLLSLLRNKGFAVEADSAGVRLTPLDLAEFRDMLRGDLDKTRKILGLDDKKLSDTTVSISERRRLAELYVDAYVEAVASNKVTFVSLPPFLAARLRERASWSISSAGVDRVVQRSAELRAVVDSLRPAPAPADSGGSNDRK